MSQRIMAKEATITLTIPGRHGKMEQVRLNNAHFDFSDIEVTREEIEEQHRSGRSYVAHLEQKIDAAFSDLITEMMGAQSVFQAAGYQLDVLASMMGVDRNPRPRATPRWNNPLLGVPPDRWGHERITEDRIRGVRCEQMIIDDPYAMKEMVRTDREYATMVQDTPDGPIYLRPQTMQDLIDGPVSELNKRDGYDNQEDNVEEKELVFKNPDQLRVGDVIHYYRLIANPKWHTMGAEFRITSFSQDRKSAYTNEKTAKDHGFALGISLSGYAFKVEEPKWRDRKITVMTPFTVARRREINNPEAPVCVIYSESFGLPTIEQTATEMCRRFNTKESDHTVFPWRLAKDGVHEDRWCIVESKYVSLNAPQIFVHKFEVEAKDPDRFTKDLESAAKKYGMVSQTMRDRYEKEKLKKVEEALAKIDEAQKARDIVVEQPPRKTIDELLDEYENSMRNADILPHPDTSQPYEPHFLMTHDHHKAWKTRLARLQHEAKEKERNQVMCDREFEDWE